MLDGRGIPFRVARCDSCQDREPRMKKIYEKPRLDKRGKLSAVVASVVSANG